MSAAKYTERALAKVARLDADIASLRDRLDARLNERRLILAGLIADGEVVRTEVSEEVRALTQASNLATTGRALTDEQVREIRRQHTAGVSQCELARRFGISQPSIFKIVRRQSYRDVA